MAVYMCALQINEGRSYWQAALIATNKAMHVSRNIKALSSSQCYHRKTISITYSDYVFVALFIPYVKCMRRIILSYVFCFFLPYFSTFSFNRHNFRKKVIEYKMCVLKFSTNFFEIFIVVRRIYRRIFINIRRSLWKVPIFVRFELKLNFFNIYSRNRYIQFKENPSTGPNCSILSDGRTHRQTEMTKLVVAIRNFTNVSKNPQHIAYMVSGLEDSLCLADYINLRKCRRVCTFVYTRLSFQFLKDFFPRV